MLRFKIENTLSFTNQQFFRQWRLRSEKAVLMQRIYRRREEWKLYLALAPFAIHVQKNVRGYLYRIIHKKWSQFIREMYFNRRKEVKFNKEMYFNRRKYTLIIIFITCIIIYNNYIYYMYTYTYTYLYICLLELE